MADHDDDELADAVRELTRTLEALRTELEDSHSRRRRPRPRLRPPTPREVLKFTDEIAIPALLTALESSIRALETFQRGLELVRTEREVRDRTSEATAAASDRADDVRQTTLSRLDTVLSELQRAASSGALPADEDARTLLTDARELRDEVDARLRDATSDSGTTDVTNPDRQSDTSSAVEIDIEEGTPAGDDYSTTTDDEDETESASAADADSNVDIDVDAELETLKDQYTDDEDKDEDEDEAAGSDDGERPSPNGGTDTDADTDTNTGDSDVTDGDDDDEDDDADHY